MADELQGRSSGRLALANNQSDPVRPPGQNCLVSRNSSSSLLDAVDRKRDGSKAEPRARRRFPQW